MSDREQASTEFTDAFCHSSSPAADCEFCGRTHFATGGHSCLEQEEVGRYRERAKAEPQNYIEDRGNDAIGWGLIDGRQAVWDCPCGTLARYERWIWGHRGPIAEYLKARAAKELRDASRNAAATAGL